MVRLAMLTCAMAVAAPAAAQPTSVSASASVNPRTVELFERDWVLMNWALKFHDRDRDVLLSATESQAAADEFRKIADGNTDGRVTPQEFRAAREFILARH